MNTTLAGGIPTDDDQVADIRVSLFRLSDSAEVTEVRWSAFQQIALELGDLSILYARARKTEGNAQSPLQKLADLQAEKNKYQANFISLGEKKNDVLADKERISQRINTIEATIASLKAELVDLTPKNSAVTRELTATISTNLQKLFRRSYSLDPTFKVLLPQKAGPEEYLQRGRDEILSTIAAWGELCASFEQAIAPGAPEEEDQS